MRKRRSRSSLLDPRSSRRGVLLLVVLSMLVLFMLIGTAFLMTSSQSQKAAKGAAKGDRLGNYATRLLDRALLQILRDSDNQYSAIRYHSLLRDLYGTDGFQGVIFNPATNIAFDPTDPRKQVTRFAGATAGTGPNDTAAQLGPTAGQFVDIYFRKLVFSANDPDTVENESLQTSYDLRNVLKLDRDVYGKPQLGTLPLTKGYFNGCLLTITSGSAAGQTSRILDYEFLGNAIDKGAVASQIFRFRVMAFPRKDGQPLQINSARRPEISDLAGAAFIVNGRAFSGTGVGFNPLAIAGQPRLNALELFKTSGTEALGAELALLPNAVYFDPLNALVAAPKSPLASTNPFQPALVTANNFALLNNPATQGAFFNYGSYPGSGGLNEGYDAPDFENMFLAFQSVTPRSRGRIWQEGSVVPLDIDDPAVDRSKFLRFDLEDVTLPSFHRPDLVNFWYHRLLNYLVSPPNNLDPNDALRGILQPFTTSGTPTPPLTGPQAALIAAIKRQVILRPSHDDNPNFDGGNPQSVPDPALLQGQTNLVRNGNITVPIWEIMGPADVDNDNDGVRDSNWVDLGSPILETEDGRRYKTLFAFHCIDLDGRLNVNAHGSIDDVVPPKLDMTRANFFDPTAGNPGNLAHDPSTTGSIYSTLQLPRGNGYGPADISLRPLLPAPFDASLNPRYGNRSESAGPIDSYAALQNGRLTIDGLALHGRSGFNTNINYPQNSSGDAATAGSNYRYALRRPNWKDDPATTPDAPMWYTTEQATPSLAATLKFFDYPWSINQPSAFGTPPDLKARYALGVDYFGQPFYEVANDRNPNNNRVWQDLLAKSPYESDLSNTQRRDEWSNGMKSAATGVQFADSAEAFNQSLVQSDDAPFSPTDLEKVLRATDADVGSLPSRLFDVVNEFDPIKLMIYDPNRVAGTANAAFGNTGQPALLASAQSIAGVNRHLVTTEQFSLPVASENFLSRLIYGADGKPGQAGVDDDNNGVVDDPGEIGWSGSDDYYRVMTGDTTAGAPPAGAALLPEHATIVDLLKYRVQYERLKQGRSIYTEAQLANVATELLAPEIVAGQRMDLNRPFGDGKDNNSDGVVDDPMEAGDPFLDVNGNGKWDTGEPFIDLAGDGYTAPRDLLWTNLTSPTGPITEAILFDYSNGQAVPVPRDAGGVPLNFTGPVLGGVRNLESQGRQLFARQLYCLMLLLTDENYIAPWDEKDPQILKFLDTTIDKSMAKNIRTAIRKTLGPDPDPNPTANQFDAKADQMARATLLRKLTCRQMAQWAINCVDMHDPDAIMTPFEYDENPWDGWGVLDRNGVNNIPLDGDPATNENGDEKLWEVAPPSAPTDPTLAANNLAEVIQWNTNGIKTILNASTTPKSPVQGPSTALNQTRGVVWGAERPELLITETLAWHDRRTEDLTGDNDGTHDELKGTNASRYRDVDLDQRLRPRGSLYVELYNPWSANGQFPAELYTRLDGTTNYLPDFSSKGVDLSRLSTLGDKESFQTGTDVPVPDKAVLTTAASTGVIKRSPVWRLIVVDDWPRARNRDRATIGNNESQLGKGLVVGDIPPDVKATPATLPAYYTPMVTDVEAWDATKPPPYRAPDPDFDAVFNPGFTPTQVTGEYNQFNIEYPYIEREFYFTTDNSDPADLLDPSDRSWGQYTDAAATRPKDWDYSPKVFKLRIPDRYIKLKGDGDQHLMHGPVDSSDTSGHTKWARSQKFIPIALEEQKKTNGNKPVIAPIPPGRYAVVGTAGTRYFKDTTKPNIFTNPIGRPDLDAKNTNDGPLLTHLDQTRRIELRPNPDPEMQQVVTESNGGDPKDQIHLGKTYDPFSVEIGRDNELVRNDANSSKIENITEPDAAGKARFYQAAVGIPVEGMSASDPPWGWAPREIMAADQEFEVAKKAKDEHPGWSSEPTRHEYVFDPLKANGEGAYQTNSGDASYDKPFDIAPELFRNGTTPNYRTTHLQRLANPQLPWNPMPGQYKDAKGADLYRPNLPVNPYRTIDSSTVNLTAMNGTSSEEHNIGNNDGHADAEGKLRPWVRAGAVGAIDELQTYVTGLNGDNTAFHSTKQQWSFRSVERGFWSRLNTPGWLTLSTGNPPPANQGVAVPQRTLWAQEPALVDLRKPWEPLVPNVHDAAELLDLVGGRQMTLRRDELPPEHWEPPAVHPEFGNQPDDLQSDQKIVKNNCDMVLKHTLGFGNESFGLLYDRKGAKKSNFPTGSNKSSQAPPSILQIAGAPASSRFVFPYDVDPSGRAKANPEPVTIESTFPWLAWDNRPYVSGDEILKVPATSQSQMLRQFTTIDPNALAANRRDPYGLDALGTSQTPVTNVVRGSILQSPFGSLPDVFASSREPANYIMGTSGVQPYGAANFSRILEFVQVPSRFVGTDTLLRPEIFNDDPNRTSTGTDPDDMFANGAVTDPRFFFRPPFNKVSRQRDPGRVNLNTVAGRRVIDGSGAPHVWSDVFDGIMHRYKNPVTGAGDDNQLDPTGTTTITLGHAGPAWRDVVLSRRGYAQVDASGTLVDKPTAAALPDTMQSGLNNNFPTMFANPFRSPDAGDLVPLNQMMQFGVDASFARVHPRNRGAVFTSNGTPSDYDLTFGDPNAPLPSPARPFGDARDAGCGNDGVSRRSNGAIPSDQVTPIPIPPTVKPTDVLPNRDTAPLFSEARSQPFSDTNRNPYMMYQPMSRLGNLVTNRSGCFAVWITVGYFEVEPAPSFADPAVQARFGGDINLYNRVYPDGYMLGKELGSETGDVKRPRGFYIIDRTEEVGFKPGEDLNVEKAIRLRRRIE